MNKLGCCRRNPPKRHFREGRSPCRDMPVIPRDAAPSAGRGERKERGAPVVPTKWEAMAPHRPGLRGAQLCRWQQRRFRAAPGALRPHGPGTQPGCGTGECAPHGAGMKVGFADHWHHGHQQSPCPAACITPSAEPRTRSGVLLSPQRDPSAPSIHLGCSLPEQAGALPGATVRTDSPQPGWAPTPFTRVPPLCPRPARRSIPSAPGTGQTPPERPLGSPREAPGSAILPRPGSAALCCFYTWSR